ncbi:uncharacterized protein F5891DRAFT_964141 [Suillus fuscotomentosus]|uniref:Uncharacterized protein n=1 Tax=Suillus fuscotomentosus TaxID=1912939 RepID=A0AAD4HDK6_9AGAM|nr:uncharacterized protein F5891DRAFT_964141 [Suillus fuscotomentosus]KAG1891763.1 hypothetical protein F5891DRAFT_964141 [Suillus fuscotomentosus]
MVGKDRYKMHLAEAADTVEKSSCNNHWAVNQANAARHKLESTGIGGVACARHSCFVPHSMVDFQKGERQATSTIPHSQVNHGQMNMDYALCEASQHNMEGITRAVTFYDINSPSKKEIKLRLLEEGNARNAAPSRRSVATWISTGLAIEEAQIALLIEVRRIGRRSTETQRLDIAHQRDRLQGQIDGFARSALTHLGEGFDADDEPEDLDVDILDDLDDDPADFTETSHTWTNSPELTVIPLPSNLGVDRCRQCMAEDLIPLEMMLCEGQANDALYNLRIYLCNKTILFRTTIRQAKSQALKTRAWSQVTSVQQAVSLHASIYTKTRKQMMKLELGQDQLQKYKPLLCKQLKISTAVGDPNARGQRNESLAWFWSVEVDLGGPDQSWNEECEFPLACHIPRLPDWTHAKFTESIG